MNKRREVLIKIDKKLKELSIRFEDRLELFNLLLDYSKEFARDVIRGRR